MVVEDSAVITELAGFSSAWATDARLTNPTAAKPAVHLLTFIRSSVLLLVMFLFPVLLYLRGQNRFTLAHQNRCLCGDFYAEASGLTTSFLRLFLAEFVLFVCKERTNFGQKKPIP